MNKNIFFLGLFVLLLVGVSADTYNDCSVYGTCTKSINSGTINVNYSQVNVNNSLTLLGYNWTDNPMNWITSATANQTYAPLNGCAIVGTSTYPTLQISGTCTLPQLFNITTGGVFLNKSSAGNPCYYIFQSLHLNVTSGSVLDLTECKFYFNNSFDGLQNINVNKYAMIILNNSIINDSTQNSQDVYIWEDSSAILSNSYIEHLGSDSTFPQGLYINTSQVYFDNMTIIGGYAQLQLNAPNIIIQNSYLKGTTSSIYNVVCDSCDNSTIKNTNMSVRVLASVVVGTNQNLIILDSNYTSSNTVSSGAKLTIKRTVKACAKDKNGYVIYGAIIDAYNRTGGFDSGGTTNALDGCAWIEMTELKQFGGSTKTFSTPLNLSISKDNYNRNFSTIINISNPSDRIVNVNLSDYVTTSGGSYNTTYNGLINNVSYLSTFNVSYDSWLSNYTAFSKYWYNYSLISGSVSSFITNQINNNLNTTANITFNKLNLTENLEIQPNTDYGMVDITIFEAGQDPNSYVDNTPIGLYWSNFDGGDGQFQFRSQGGIGVPIYSSLVNADNIFSSGYIYASGPVYENNLQLSSTYLKNGNNATCFGALCTTGDFNRAGVTINSSQGLRISGNGTGTNTLLTMCNENGTSGTTTNIACLRWTGFSGPGRPELQAIYKDGTVKGIFEFRGGSSSSIFVNAEDFVFYNNKRIAMLHANAPNGNGGTVQMMNILTTGEAQIGPTYTAVTSGTRYSVPRADFFGAQNNLTSGYWDWRMAVPGGSTITYARIDNTTRLNYYGQINGTNISAINYFANSQLGISRNISINNSAGTKCDMNFTGGLLVSSNC